MPYGIDWNSAEEYSEGLSFGKWVSTIDGNQTPDFIRISLCY